MSRAGKSRRWYQEHTRDSYVKQAQRDGYRSRAAYKLLEIDKRHRLLRQGLRVAELGCAPGGWTQVLQRRLGGNGRIVACDLLAMDPVGDVAFFRGDFTHPDVQQQLSTALGGDGADLVISDMAPNLSGIRDRDRALAEELVVAAADFARDMLAPGGGFLAKLFTGPEADSVRAALRREYAKVSICKPSASRDASTEIYVLAQGFGI